MCGGYAKRMLPLTKNRPKHLLYIWNKPMVDSTVQDLLECNQIDQIYLVTNYKFKKQFKEYLNDKKIKLIIEKTKNEDEKLGSVGGLEAFIKNQKIKDDLLIVGGDNVFNINLCEFVSSNKNVKLGIYDYGKISSKLKLYGTVNMRKNRRVVSFKEKSKNPKSHLISTALYFIPKNKLSMVSKFLKTGGDKDAFGHFISYLVKNCYVEGFVFKSKWYDIGSFGSYFKAWLKL